MINPIPAQTSINFNHSKATPAAESSTKTQDSVLLCSGSDLASLIDAKTIEAACKPEMKIQEKPQIDPSEKTEKKVTLANCKNVAEKVIDFADDMANTISAFPSFIYPSVAGTKEQIAFTYDVLDQLPLKTAASSTHIQWVDKLTLLYDKTQEASGMALPIPGTNFIGLSNSAIPNLSSDFAKEVIVHESAHTRDYSEAFLNLIGMESEGDIWGKPPHITEYSKHNRLEDFAESLEQYYIEPEKLKTECPEKYERIVEMEKLGKFEGSIEQEAFRKTGRFIGEQMSKVPYLNPALSLLGTGTDVYRAIKSGKKLSEGISEGNAQKQLDGALKLTAATLCASQVFSMAGLAVDGAGKAISRAIKNDEITPEEANYLVSRSIGAPAQGVVRAGKWISSKLHKNKTDKAEEGQTTQTNLEEKPQEKITNKKIAKVASIATGGAAGSLTGAMLGIYGGVTAGYSIAGPIGGAIGMVLGATVGTSAMNRAGGELGTLVGNLIVGDESKNELTQKENEGIS